MIVKEETTIIAMEIEQISSVEDVKTFENTLRELIKYGSWRIISGESFNLAFIFYHEAIIAALKNRLLSY